ncbi:hypothetical protein NQ317_001079 [Molorchus minor]|uniref:Uncharacterized protein n=1 Tax=Molorchus minor TaxID=1323400 RepID=A0ABQ9JP21_9CUCU|nr:hypothetical protein NQ317_001079 [Molorchus minor]
MPENDNNDALPQAGNGEVEPYKLREIFSIVPEFEGDQIFLNTFLNACDCAYQMASTDQKFLLTLHVKNRLRGRAAQLISSRNPNTYPEIKQLLNLHFGDSRDLTSLIQDLQRLRQLQGESALTFFNRLQVHNAKMHASIQKSNLTGDQKIAQARLIETMALNTLLTGLEPRLGQIIRASNPRDLLEAHMRVRRELQLSYFENAKFNKPNQPRNNNNAMPAKRPPPMQQKFCSYCRRSGHTLSECYQNKSQTNHQQQFRNFNSTFQRQPNFQNSSNNHNSYQNNRPQNNYSNQQNRPQSNFQNQSRQPIGQNQFQPRPSVIQPNPNFQNRQNPMRPVHHVNLQDQQDYYTDNSQHNYQPDYYTDNGQYNYQQEYYTDNTNNIQDDYNDFQNYQTNEYESIPNNYQDFLTLPDLNNTPDTNTQSTDPSSTIQSQMLTLNLDDMNPNLNFSEQNFI